MQHRNTISLRSAVIFGFLFGATTALSACSSAEPDAGETVSVPDISIAEQSLRFSGGCVCLPERECPSSSSRVDFVDSCRTPHSELIGTACPKLLCAITQVVCVLDADGTSCTRGLTKSTCDGGYCGTCPYCYSSTGICDLSPSQVTSCGLKGTRCQNCNDSNACTEDSCNATTGTCVSKELSGTTCTGGTCVSGTCCQGCVSGSSCQAGNTPSACGTAGATCATCTDDGNPCTTAVCESGSCKSINVAKGTSCSDGNACNGVESCDGEGKCVAGAFSGCTGTDPCFDYSCDPSTGCIKKPKTDAPCNDNDSCTEGDKCDDTGRCVGGKATFCDDGNACTEDGCDKASGCTHRAMADGELCDDGSACTTGEACKNGDCTYEGKTCDDKRPCTSDERLCTVPPTCNNDAASMNGKLCLSSDRCVVETTCSDGECTNGVPVNCEDYNPCTIDSCEPSTGCVHKPADATVTCNDNNPCTVEDKCDVNGNCAGVSRDCPRLDDCHLPGTCDATTGLCGSESTVDDGTLCAEGKGTCRSGSCRLDEPSVGGATGAGGSSTGDAGNGGAENESSRESSGGSSVHPSGSTSKPSKTKDDDEYQRNPGGCSCAVVERRAFDASWLSLGLLALVLRRKRTKGARLS